MSKNVTSGRGRNFMRNKHELRGKARPGESWERASTRMFIAWRREQFNLPNPGPSSRADAPAEKNNSPAVAAAIRVLSLEAAVEAANVAAISARHFCENVDIQDFAVAEHNLRVAIVHLREAAAQFRAWQSAESGQ